MNYFPIFRTVKGEDREENKGKKGKMKNITQQFQDIIIEDCKSCWAVNFCTLCFAQLYDGKSKNISCPNISFHNYLLRDYTSCLTGQQ